MFDKLREYIKRRDAALTEKIEFDRKEWAKAVVAEAVRRDAIGHLWAAIKAHFSSVAFDGRGA